MNLMSFVLSLSVAIVLFVIMAMLILIKVRRMKRLYYYLMNVPRDKFWVQIEQYSQSMDQFKQVFVEQVVIGEGLAENNQLYNKQVQKQLLKQRAMSATKDKLKGEESGSNFGQKVPVVVVMVFILVVWLFQIVSYTVNDYYYKINQNLVKVNCNAHITPVVL